MRFFLLLLSLPAWLALPSAHAARSAFQARCEDGIPHAQVQVTSRGAAGFTIDHTQSYRSLARLKGQVPARALVLGLTRTESRVAVRSTGAIVQDPASGYECLAPRLAVELWYTPAVIYVGREFGAGTCSYREILAHEQRHYLAYLNHLPGVERRVRAALQQRFADRPLYAPRGQSSALLSAEIDARWLPYIKSELGQVERVQAAIDSPAEYARLSKVCAGEVQSIIRSQEGKR